MSLLSRSREKTEIKVPGRGHSGPDPRRHADRVAVAKGPSAVRVQIRLLSAMRPTTTFMVQEMVGWRRPLPFLVHFPMKIPAVTIVILASLMWSGCTNPGVVQLSPGTYLLTRTDKGGAFGNPSRMKADVINDANDFAASQGKVAIPISSKESPMYIGHFASFDYQFRLVNKDDPAAKGTQLIPSADVVVETTEKDSGDIHTTNGSAKTDVLYTELTKLDDLRKRGILTDEEFAAEKKKLLDDSK
jgi:hypothetical protein